MLRVFTVLFFVFYSNAVVSGFFSELFEEEKIEFPPLKIESIEIRELPDARKREDHEIVIVFDRPLTEEELKPATGYIHTYGLRYWLFSKTGWKHEPWGSDPSQMLSGLGRDNESAYLLTSESSHHPLRGYDEDTDQSFNKDNISKIVIELYKRDRFERDSEYQLVQTVAFTDFGRDESESSDLEQATEPCKLEGKVIGISDGDTINVLDDNKKQHKIRLAGIDTPEKKQPYGNAAKKNLSKMIAKKRVCVDWYKHDKYQRKIGYIFIDDLDVNFEMVASGYAWHYKKYQDEQSPEDRKRYSEAEKQAKLSVIGLWSEPDPVAPWDWRDGVRPVVKAEKQESPKPTPQKLQATPSSGFTCSGKRFCKHMDSCDEAYFYLDQCGLKRLDRDKDGIPCESICGG